MSCADCKRRGVSEVGGEGIPQEEDSSSLNIRRLRDELCNEEYFVLAHHTIMKCTEPTQLPRCSLYRKRKSGWRRVIDPTTLVCDEFFPLVDPGQKVTPSEKKRQLIASILNVCSVVQVQAQPGVGLGLTSEMVGGCTCRVLEMQIRDDVSRLVGPRVGSP